MEGVGSSRTVGQPEGTSRTWRQRDMSGCWDLRLVYDYNAKVEATEVVLTCDVLRIISSILPCLSQPFLTYPFRFDIVTTLHCALQYPYRHLVVVCGWGHSMEIPPSRSPTPALLGEPLPQALHGPCAFIPAPCSR